MSFVLIMKWSSRMTYDLSRLDNKSLMHSLSSLVRKQNQTCAVVLAHLGEVDARRLYLEQACSSMFVYCTQRLHLSEPAAYKRIQAARLARRFPVILERLAKSEIHLSAITLLSPILTESNHLALLDQARHQSKRQVEQLVAGQRPKPEVPTQIRVVPQPSDRLAQALELRDASHVTGEPGVVSRAELSTARSLRVRDPQFSQTTPLGMKRFHLQLTVEERFQNKLAQAQALLRHRNPHGDLAETLERGLDALLVQLKKERFAVGSKSRTKQAAEKDTPASAQQSLAAESVEPSPGSAGFDKNQVRTRHIPSEIKRQVYERDGMRCTYRASNGRRCAETGMLELHHVQAFALGGGHEPDNIAVFCRAHNQHAGRQLFGEWVGSARPQG